METPLEQVIKACEALGIKPAERVLAVRISSQTLQFYRGGALVRCNEQEIAREHRKEAKRLWQA